MCVGYFCCFFKQTTAYEMRISDCSSDVCSSDLVGCEGRARVVVEDPERHREGAEAHLDQHVRDAAVGDIVHDHPRGLPVAIDHVDDLEFERVMVERDALGALGIEHRFALLEPELPVFGAPRCGKILEPVFLIDDQVLKSEGGCEGKEVGIKYRSR